jgi:hypothetical protein
MKPCPTSVVDFVPIGEPREPPLPPGAGRVFRPQSWLHSDAQTPTRRRLLPGQADQACKSPATARQIRLRHSVPPVASILSAKFTPPRVVAEEFRSFQVAFMSSVGSQAFPAFVLVLGESDVHP